MEFVTHNTNDVDINGTHLQGHIKCSYDRLTELLGEPMEGDGYKVDAEWALQFDDDTISTIYNWKNGKSYCGDRGLSVENINEWNIGGISINAVSHVNNILGDKGINNKERLCHEYRPKNNE